MKEGDVIEVEIIGLGDNGEGVAVFDGNTVFIPFALQGEKVSARVTHVKRSGTSFAEMREIITASTDRRKPSCPVFGVCGGCQLMHMSYAAQLDFKRRLVEKNLLKLGGICAQVEVVAPSERVLGYRNKVQQPVGFRRGRAFTGFFRAGTHDIIPVSECPLQEEKARAAVRIFGDFLNSSRASVYDERTGEGLVRHILARMENDCLLVTVVINGEDLPRWEALYDALSEKYPQVGLFININREKTNVVLGKETRHLKGLRAIKSKMCGINFSLQPDSFFQVNRSVAENIYHFTKQVVLSEKTEVLIECFSGVGILSAMLADDAFDSVGIEIVRSAWEDAQMVKKENNLRHLTNICGDVNVELPRLAEKYSGRHVTIVVDPPRKGLDKSVRNTLTALQPQTIVYISCDSATLSRDAADFVAAGYYLTTVRPFDLFPQTRHVETLVCLSKKDIISHIEVDVEFGEGEGQLSLKDITKRAEARKPKPKTTYKMIQQYVEDKYGFKVHTAYIAEVKRSLGLPMYDAPNAVDVRTHEPQHPSPKMIEAIKDALAYYEII